MTRSVVTTCGPAHNCRERRLILADLPKPGSDAVEILAEIGMEGRIDDLVASGVIRLDGVAADNFQWRRGRSTVPRCLQSAATQHL